jgi:hypothetical protein
MPLKFMLASCVGLLLLFESNAALPLPYPCPSVLSVVLFLELAVPGRSA